MEQLEVKYLGLRGISFGIGSEKTILAPSKLPDLMNYLTYYEQWYQHWSEYVKRYDDFLNQIPMILKMQEEKYKLYYGEVENPPPFSYNAGDDFSHLHGIPIEGFNCETPADAAESIQKMIEDPIDPNPPVFTYNVTNEDPDSKMVNILTTNKKDAAWILTFIYKNIVTKVIEFINKEEKL